MAHLIIWGDSRSVLAGAHPGADEVHSLAGLEAALADNKVIAEKQWSVVGSEKILEAKGP